MIYRLYIEGLATTTNTLGVRVSEDELCANVVFFPVHCGASNLQQCRRFDENAHSFLIDLLIKFSNRVSIIHRVRNTIAATYKDRKLVSE